MAPARGRRGIRLAARRQRVLMVGHLLLYHPAVRYLKDLAARGELGDLHYVYSQRVNLGKVRRDENALWSFAPHDLSVILHLFEAEPLDVVARGSAFLQRGVEDVVFVDLRFPDGRLADQRFGDRSLCDRRFHDGCFHGLRFGERRFREPRGWSRRLRDWRFREGRFREWRLLAELGDAARQCAARQTLGPLDVTDALLREVAQVLQRAGDCQAVEARTLALANPCSM